MRKMIFAALVIICALVVIVSFFAPWAKASVSATKVARNLTDVAGTTLKNTPFAGRFIKQLDKAMSAIGSFGDVEVKTTVSGYDIPTMINKKSSKVALSLAQSILKDVKDLDKKSLLVYLLPVFGIVCIALALLGLKNKIAIIAIALISGVIATGGLYNLMTVNLSGLPVQISIERGLWQTMYGYLSMCLVSIVWFVMELKQ